MNPITSTPRKTLKGAHLRNTDYVTRSQHGGALLVTKKQIANQAVCSYCRAVTSKQTITQHAQVCKVQSYTDARPLYDSLGAPLKRGPKPVQGGAAMPKPTTPEPLTTQAKGSEIRSILRTSEAETPLSQYASSAGIDQAKNSTVRFTMEHYLDITGDATTPWQDIGPNVNSVFNGDGFGGVEAQAKLVTAAMDVLPPNSFANTNNATNTVLVVGGTPMSSTNQEGVEPSVDPKPRLMNSFAKSILASDKARWTRVAKVNYAKLLSEGWRQESLASANTVTAFRVSLCNPDTGAAFTNSTSLQARFTYTIEVEFPVFVKLAVLNHRTAKVTDGVLDTSAGASAPAVMEPTSVRRGNL